MDVIVIGAGGLGREVRDVVADVSTSGGEHAQPKLNFLGFVADGHPDLALLERLDARYLGGTEVLDHYRGVHFVAAVGDPGLRRELADRAEAAGLIPLTLIHPAASIGSDVEVGPGSILCAGVRVTTNVRIGRHVLLNLNVTVGHDSVIEDFVSVNPLASISGNVRIRTAAMVGTNACVNQRLTVGSHSVVGSGAAVVRSVADHATVVGVPARPLKRT